MEQSTRAIHMGFPSLDDSHAAAIAMTSAYDFTSAQEASDRFNGVTEGNIYSRFTNPSVEHFERKLTSLENAEAAVAFASGMAAYLALAMTFLKQGDHVVLASGIFGTTTHLFRQYFGQFGITATCVDLDDQHAWQAAMCDRTRMILVESPTNPLLKVADLSWLSGLAKRNHALLVVDNTLLSPVNQRPLNHGADLVLHSTGKFMDGQGRTVGGVIAGRKDVIQPLKNYLRSSGTCMNAFTAWVLSHGLDTLTARMAMHEQNARKVEAWLRQQSCVKQVFSTFSPVHPQAEVIAKQQTGHSPVISFIVEGGQAAAWRCIDALNLVARCTNIGDTKSMVTHPASTTHCRYSQEEKLQYGISDGLVRLCVGLEASQDIIQDLGQALAASQVKHSLREVVSLS
ncbi:trans-sulfuration enzyme family protein [Photobacterium halotolerans]|nr:aminotransferase class I/II-fold pyridoxal phosphate-dependent enzyme [Photobacterium halotolerans]